MRKVQLTPPDTYTVRGLEYLDAYLLGEEGAHSLLYVPVHAPGTVPFICIADYMCNSKMYEMVCRMAFVNLPRELHTPDKAYEYFELNKQVIPTSKQLHITIQ